MTTAPAGAGQEGLAAWLSRLGPLARHRPPPTLGRALAGTGGALVAAGTIALAGDAWSGDGSTGVAVLLTGALVAGSLFALVRGPEPVRVAAVAASGLSAPALAFFLVSGGTFPSLRTVALLAGLAVGGLYVAGPWRGHTFHLAILVVAGWLLAVSLANDGPGGSPFGAFTTLADQLNDAGAFSLLVGAGYLAAGWWLDGHGLEGMATPFLGTGCVALPVGAFLLVRDADAGLGLLALAAGSGMAGVGAAARRRRGTTWLGVALVAVGIALLADAVAPADGAVVVGLLLAAAGAGLVAAAPAVARALREPALADGAGAPPAVSGRQQPPGGSSRPQTEDGPPAFSEPQPPPGGVSGSQNAGDKRSPPAPTAEPPTDEPPTDPRPWGRPLPTPGQTAGADPPTEQLPVVGRRRVRRNPPDQP